MIQKRVGIGYDLNYGNPISKILAIIVGVILIGMWFVYLLMIKV